MCSSDLLDGAQRMTAMHWNERLNAHERQFAYLPFEHAEQLEAQKASMPHFDRLADACGSQDLLEWSRKHYVIVDALRALLAPQCGARAGARAGRNRVLTGTRYEVLNLWGRPCSKVALSSESGCKR